MSILLRRNFAKCMTDMAAGHCRKRLPLDWEQRGEQREAESMLKNMKKRKKQQQHVKQVHFNSYAPGWLEGRCSPFLHPSRRASRYFCGQTWHRGQKPLGSQAFTGLILLPINTMLVRTNLLCKIRQWFCTFSCNHFPLEANPTWTIGSAVPQKEIKGDDRLTCSSRRTVWTDWWFHPPLCWTSPQLLLVPARGSLRRSPASASSHLSNRNALWNETLWKNLKIKVLEIIGGDGGVVGGMFTFEQPWD